MRVDPRSHEAMYLVSQSSSEDEPWNPIISQEVKSVEVDASCEAHEKLAQLRLEQVLRAHLGKSTSRIVS